MKLLKVLASAASVTDETEPEVEAELMLIGKRHRLYGVKSDWFTDARDAMMWTLKQPEFFGSKWNPQLEAAWFAGFNLATKIMRRQIRKSEGVIMPAPGTNEKPKAESEKTSQSSNTKSSTCWVQ